MELTGSRMIPERNTVDDMTDQRLTIPDLLSVSRLLLVPVLWGLALTGRAFAVGVGLAICGLTDWLDGFLARRLNQSSPYGAKLDSLADQVLLLSTVVWVWLLRPEMFRDNWIAAVVALGVYLLSLAVGLVKFRRVANLHLALSRVTAYVLYALLIHNFLAPAYSPWLFWAAWLMFTLSSLETLVLQLISPEVDEHMGSLWRVLRQRRLDHRQTSIAVET